jgi:hypothetical protein
VSKLLHRVLPSLRFIITCVIQMHGAFPGAGSRWNATGQWAASGSTRRPFRTDSPLNASVNQSINISRPVGSPTVPRHAASAWRTFYAFISREHNDHFLRLQPGKVAEVIRNPGIQTGVIDRLLAEGVQSSRCRQEMVETVQAVWEELDNGTYDPGTRVVDLLRSYVVRFSLSYHGQRYDDSSLA